jgi:hypothetical protein
MSQYLDRLNRSLSPHVRDGYSYFGPFLISDIEISCARQDYNGVAHYRTVVTLKDGRVWTIELRYSELYNSMKWLEIYDKHKHLPCDVPFPPKDNNSVMFSYNQLPPGDLEKRRYGLNKWLQSRVRFCCTSQAKVVVRIQAEINYLLKTTENLHRMNLDRAEPQISYANTTAPALGSSETAYPGAGAPAVASAPPDPDEAQQYHQQLQQVAMTREQHQKYCAMNAPQQEKFYTELLKQQQQQPSATTYGHATAPPVPVSSPGGYADTYITQHMGEGSTADTNTSPVAVAVAVPINDYSS